MTKHGTLKTTSSILAAAAAVVLLMLSGGCQPIDEHFEPEGAERSVHRFADAHAASGARADAMMHAYHFDGAELNTLGEQKLGLMLQDDDACEPLVVYMNVKEDDQIDERMVAVTTFLKDNGLADEQIKFEVGPNPNSRHSVTDGLAALNRSRNQAAGQSERSEVEDRTTDGSADMGIDSGADK